MMADQAYCGSLMAGRVESVSVTLGAACPYHHLHPHRRHLHLFQQSPRDPCVRVRRHTVRTLVSDWANELGLTYILETPNCIIDVSRRELVQLLVVPKYDDSHIDRTKDTQLVRFLEQAAFAFQECAIHALGQLESLCDAHRAHHNQHKDKHSHRAVPVILDGPDLNLPAAHVLCW